MGFRFILLSIVFAILYGLLGFNLYELQIERGDYYFNKAKAQSEYAQSVAFKRGEIFFTDRNGNAIPAATNKNYPVIYAVPREIKDAQATAATLKTLFPESGNLLNALSDPKRLFVPILRRATDEDAARAEESGLAGIYVDEEKARFYPFGELAARTLGFVGVNEEITEPTGIYGLERWYNPTLSREEPLYTTIDRNLETEVEKLAQELVETHNAEAGTIIIQEPHTGKILAIAHYPSFDPNEYGKYLVGRFGNPAVEYLYEPGSVMKPMTMAAGIDLNIITPDTTYWDKGEITLNGKTIGNWDGKAHGEITMRQVIEGSVNTGAVFAGRKTGRKSLLSYFEKFGFGSETGVDLPHEVAGNLANLSRIGSREIDLATASFGQGIAVTPLELINAYSALANGGNLMRPYLNAEHAPHVVRRVISEATAAAVTEMMESAVNKAVIGAVDGYRVAGKTGTAQIPDFESGGYTEEYVHTFVGFAPVSNPQFVILLKLDKPEVLLAGQTVVPAFRRLMQFVLGHYNVPPDNLE